MYDFLFDRQTHTQTDRNGQAHRYIGEILQIYLKTGSGVNLRSLSRHGKNEEVQPNWTFGSVQIFSGARMRFHLDRRKLTKAVRWDCRISFDQLCWLVPEPRLLWQWKCATGWVRRTLLSSAVLLLLPFAWCHWCGRRSGVRQGVHNCDVPCQAATTCQRIRVKPYGRFPSPLTRPVGTFAAGILVCFESYSYGLVDLVERRAFLHDSPWVRYEVTTVVPHGQGCASQGVRLRRRPTATRITSSE